MLLTSRTLRFAGVFMLLSGILLISGCAVTSGTSVQADFYQLNEIPNQTLQGAASGPVVGIGPVQLPEYINRPQIVTRNSTHKLNVSEFHRWIEPLKDNINRVLVTNLSNHLNSNRVYSIPRNERDYPLALRVAIDIRHFEGSLADSAYLEAQWTVYDKDGKPLLSSVSLIQEKLAGPDYESLVKAMNMTLQTLGKEISATAKQYLGN